MMLKNGIIRGTLILTISGIFVKILGFYNRIFLTRLIGVEEIGIYQLIFPIYILAFAICCQGTQIALTKQVSHYFGLNKIRYAKYILNFSLFISLFLSFVLSLTIYTNSDYISRFLLKNTDCSILLKILAPAIIFVSIKGCINGYFLGMKKPGLNAISLVVEQIFRLLITIMLGYSFSASNKSAILATIALTGGEFIACLVTIILFIYSDKLTASNSSSKTTLISKSDKSILIKILVKDSVPLTLNKSALTLLSGIEAILIPSMLFNFCHDKTVSMELFGIITGVVMPFILFPATLTNSLSSILLPEISFANAKGNYKVMKKAFNGSLIFCLFLGFMAYIGFFVLGKWLGYTVFDSYDSGIILKKMAFLCPLIYTATTMSSILNGIDNVIMNLIYHIISIAIRIGFIIYLVPAIGINGYIYGMAISYIFLNIAILINISLLLRKKNRS